MTWYAIYQTEDGRLVSGTDDPTKVASANVLKCRGYAVSECPDGSQNGAWNMTTCEFDPALPEMVLISADQFLDLFTATEIQRCYASDNAELAKMLRRLQVRSTPLDLMSPTVGQGLALIAALGYYDDQHKPGAQTNRPATILAWRP